MLPLLSGKSFSQARSVNDVGQIVGRATSSDFTADVPVLWSAGRVQPLPEMDEPPGGWTEAFRINEGGMVVGWHQVDGKFSPLAWLPRPTRS